MRIGLSRIVIDTFPAISQLPPCRIAFRTGTVPNNFDMSSRSSRRLAAECHLYRAGIPYRLCAVIAEPVAELGERLDYSNGREPTSAPLQEKRRERGSV